MVDEIRQAEVLTDEEEQQLFAGARISST